MTTAAQQALAALAADHERVKESLHQIVDEIERDPIRALSVRYSEQRGFTARSIPLRGKILDGEIHLVNEASQTSPTFDPPADALCRVEVEPLSLLVLPGFVLLAIRMSHELGTSVRLNLGERSTGRGPQIQLVDPVAGHYLDPVAASLEGELLSGLPRVAIIAFEAPRDETDRLVIHLGSDLFENVDCETGSVRFESRGDELGELFSRLQAMEKPRQVLLGVLSEQVEEIRKGYLAQNRGCSWVGAVLGGVALIIALLMALDVVRFLGSS